MVGLSEQRLIHVGNQAFFCSEGIAIAPEMHESIREFERMGASPILIAVDRTTVTVVAIADPIREDALACVTGLKQSGWQLGILSGDNQAVVDRVAERLSIDSDWAVGALSPEEKLDHVTASHDFDGPTVMVGDGANDAAALATADVGIAVRGGAEVSLQAAPIYVASPELDAINRLLTAAQKARTLLILTFAAALTYNAIAVGLAVAGLITPLAAAVLMPLSSVSVLTITLMWPMYPNGRPS